MLCGLKWIKSSANAFPDCPHPVRLVSILLLNFDILGGRRCFISWNLPPSQSPVKFLCHDSPDILDAKFRLE
jgi:hypothetical protein